MENKKWGFLRENEKSVIKWSKKALKKGREVVFSPLPEYLAVIFPKVNDWEHNKRYYYEGRKYHGVDYVSDNLKLAVEFDGILGHYTNPEKILRDEKKACFLRDKGYKFINIPYFIQFTNEVVEQMFGVVKEEPLFDSSTPSFVDDNTPTYLCPLGIKRMAKEFKRYPQQYKVNLEALKAMSNSELSGIDYLTEEYEKL